GLLRVDGPGELPLRRVVLEQVRQVVGRDDVADGDHLDLLAEQPLLVEGPEHEPSDATETIDGDAGHSFFSPSCAPEFSMTDLYTGWRRGQARCRAARPC